MRLLNFWKVFKYKIMFVKILRLLSLCAIGALASCSKPSSDPAAGADFSRTTMLTQTSDSLILPSLTLVEKSMTALETATDTFSYNKTEINLTALQNAWKQTVRSWQYFSPFDFSPGKQTTLDLSIYLATFPVDSAGVEAYNETGGSNQRGFYAMEVLLFPSNKSNTEIVALFNQARITHLNWLIDQANSKITKARADWNANYHTFVSDNSNNAGSSITYLFNAWLAPTGGYESIKNYKIGQPMGLKICTTGSTSGVCSFGSRDYRRLEGFRSGISLELIKIQWSQVKKIWYGAPSGFYEYLQSVSNGQQTISQAAADMADIDSKLALIPTNQSLSVTVQSDSQSPLVADLYTAMVKNTRNFKSELVSKLGMTITYTSGDGD